jgi:hypothetical protein
VAKFVENQRKLLLQVTRKNRVGDRPTNDGEVLGERTFRFGSAEVTVECAIAFANPVSVSVLSPARRVLFKGLPILIACVAIPKFSSINDPRKRMCVVPSETIRHPVSDRELERPHLLRVKPMLKRKQRR